MRTLGMKRIVWRDTALWLTLTVSGFLGPVGIGIVVRSALGKALTLEWVTGGGYFAVSSAGLLMTTLYFVARPGLTSRLPFTEGFISFFVIQFFVGITLFVLATLHPIEDALNPTFYQWPSIVLFCVALLTASTAVALDKTRDIENTDFLKVTTQAQRKDIEEDFDETFREG